RAADDNRRKQKMPTVNNITDLNNAIAADNAVTGSGTLTITLGHDIPLGDTAITPINIQTGMKLVIDGGGFGLDGGGTQRGLFVYAGTVDIMSLLIKNMQARGGDGGFGAGG